MYTFLTQLEDKINDKTLDKHHHILLKRLHSLSRILEKIASNINIIFSECNEAFGVFFKPNQKESVDITKLIYSKNENLYDLLTKMNVDDDFEENLENDLKKIKNLKKYQKEDSLGYKMNFWPMLKILNFKCYITERLLFTLFAYDQNASPKLKISLINKIQKTYFPAKKKNDISNEENQDKTQTLNEKDGYGNFDPGVADYFVSEFISKKCQNHKLSAQVIRAWKFRNKTVKLERNVQFLLNKNFPEKKFEEPILQSVCLKIDKYDFLQIFDFNFKYVYGLFNFSNWKANRKVNFFSPEARNKKKVIDYFSGLMYRLGKYLDYIETTYDFMDSKYEEINYLKVKKKILFKKNFFLLGLHKKIHCSKLDFCFFNRIVYVHSE